MSFVVGSLRWVFGGCGVGGTKIGSGFAMGRFAHGAGKTFIFSTSTTPTQTSSIGTIPNGTITMRFCSC